MTKVNNWQLGQDTNTLDDPLLDSLELLSKLLGRSTTRTAIRSGLPLSDNRLSVELFPRAANRAGLASRVVRRPLNKLSKLELPAILLLKSGGACVVVRVDDDAESLKVLLPEADMGEQEVTRDELQDLYTGYAIFVRPKYRPDQNTVGDLESHSDSWFWGTLTSSWRIYRDVLAASFLINLFALATPFFILNVYDRVVPNQAFETLWVLAIGISIIYMFDMIMKALRGYFIDIAAKKAELKISSMLLEKVLGLRMETRPRSVGAFTKNLQEFDSVREFITSATITALIDLPFALLSLAALWYIADSMVWIVITAILILVLYAYFVQAPLRKSASSTFKAGAEKNAILVESLSGIETIKTLGAENQVQRTVEESVSHMAKWSTSSRLISSSVSNVSSFVANMVTVGVVISAVYQIGNGDLTQGGLIATMILSRRTLAPMTQVVSLTTRYHRAKIALASLNKLMAMPVERPPGKSFLHRSAIKGGIELKNVDFSYPGQANVALKNVSLKLNPGERIAVIGPTGSGKTTMGKLILGLYEQNSGMVSIDDTDIRQIDLSELRHFIGYVPQDITLFSGTVRENIVLGTHDVSDDLILQAAELAGVMDFVKQHPLGFDMQVGERGSQLSGGQRQSVALARAVLTDPPILVLDEPTNSLDNKTETQLIERLSRMLAGKTLILITHRATTLKLVDRVIVMEKGQKVADGPKEQVISALKSGKLNTYAG